MYRKVERAGIVVGRIDNGDCAPQILDQVDLTGPIGLLMGGEGRGLRDLTVKSCDYLARIDMRGSVASMNVSVATGVVYEVSRQEGMLAS